jgi:hypothetical protein
MDNPFILQHDDINNVSMNLYHKLNSIKLINKYDTDKQAEFRDGEQTVGYARRQHSYNICNDFLSHNS